MTNNQKSNEIDKLKSQLAQSNKVISELITIQNEIKFDISKIKEKSLNTRTENKLNRVIIITIIKNNLILTLVLLFLITLSFFDEQIYIIINQVFSSLTQNYVSLIITVLSLIIAFVQSIIAFITLKNTQNKKN